MSWFAVGCYYLLVGKNEPARRYLCKATDVDRAFGPAWLAFGHSFAAESEHDQAMAAYFKASHVMKGSVHDQAMAAYFKALHVMKGSVMQAAVTG